MHSEKLTNRCISKLKVLQTNNITHFRRTRALSLIAREKQEEDEKENQEKIIRKVRLLSEYFHHLSHQRTDDERYARQRIRKKIITTSTLFYIIFFSSMERICSFSTDSKKKCLFTQTDSNKLVS